MIIGIKIFSGIRQIQISQHLKIQDGGHFLYFWTKLCWDSFGLSDIAVYLYVFTYSEAFYVIFSLFKYIIITFEGILTQLFMHI